MFNMWGPSSAEHVLFAINDRHIRIQIQNLNKYKTCSGLDGPRRLPSEDFTSTRVRLLFQFVDDRSQNFSNLTSNYVGKRSDLLTWMKWDTPSVSKYWATTAPEETILFTCNNSFVDFKEEICFLFHFFFHLELVPFLLHKKHCIGVWVDRLGAEIFVFLLKLFFAKKTLSVPLFLMSQIQTPLQHTVRRTWSLTI